MMTKSGVFFSKPSILQSNLGLSSFIVLEVVNKQSYLDLIKFPNILDLILVIHLSFLFIVNESLEIASLASTKGN